MAITPLSKAVADYIRQFDLVALAVVGILGAAIGRAGVVTARLRNLPDRCKLKNLTCESKEAHRNASADLVRNSRSRTSKMSGVTVIDLNNSPVKWVAYRSQSTRIGLHDHVEAACA
jgi:hypothetical protein